MSALVGLDIALAVAGLAVLAGLAWRLWRQVKAFGETVSDASDRIEDAQGSLAGVARRPAVGRRRP